MKNSKQFTKDDMNHQAGELYQEKLSFQRYLRDSEKWQGQMLYVGIAGVLLLGGIFLILVQMAWK